MTGAKVESATPRTDAVPDYTQRCESQHGDKIVTSSMCLARAMEEAEDLRDLARQLERELSTARADAERYRWLRDRAPVAELDINSLIYTDPKKTDEQFDAEMREQEDEAIRRAGEVSHE